MNDHILLLFSELILLLELVELGLESLSVGSEARPMGYLHVESLPLDKILKFLVVQALKESLASFLHLDKTRFESLPQLVVGGSSNV